MNARLLHCSTSFCPFLKNIQTTLTHHDACLQGLHHNSVIHLSKENFPPFHKITELLPLETTENYMHRLSRSLHCSFSGKPLDSRTTSVHGRRTVPVRSLP